MAQTEHKEGKENIGQVSGSIERYYKELDKDTSAAGLQLSKNTTHVEAVLTDIDDDVLIATLPHPAEVAGTIVRAEVKTAAVGKTFKLQDVYGSDVSGAITGDSGYTTVLSTGVKWVVLSEDLDA